MKQILAVLGAGESGVGTAVLAQTKGFQVFVSDFGKIADKYKRILEEHSIDFEELQHTESKIVSADEVVKSPGIPDTAPIVKLLQEKRIPIISEIEFAGRYTDAKMICITGSNGKTTTTLMLFDLLKKAGLNVGLAGNIGDSLAMQVAKNNFTYYVLELSSFQLDGMYQFKADIAVIMNITPDHLDRYDYKMQNYIDSKFRILQNMTADDVFIYCADDKILQQEVEKRIICAAKYPFSVNKEEIKGACLKGDFLEIISADKVVSLSKEKLALPGIHNMYNAMASAIAARVLNIGKTTIEECLFHFKGVEHRLEKVAEVNGVKFINDSKATNINSTWYALDSMQTPVIWIVGGIDKGNDYQELYSLVEQKVKAVICLGIDNQKIRRAFQSLNRTIVEAKSMNSAVQQAYKLAEKGDTVLLSPACASFDLFKSYEDRGVKFKKEVCNL